MSNWASDPISSPNYWHRFFSHQPDLNYDNPAVRGNASPSQMIPKKQSDRA
jgi:glycosidase